MKRPALSAEGLEFLNDPVMLAALSVIAASVSSTPEEYLYRFERAIEEAPEALFGIFEKNACVGNG